MRGTFAMLAAITLLTTSPARAVGVCDAPGSDEAAVYAVGAAIDATCPCASAAGPSEYKRCVRTVILSAVASAQLPVGCASWVQTSYLPSTCGYPAGSVACGRRHFLGTGRVRCRILKPGIPCTPPSNGIACQNIYNCFNAKADTWTAVTNGLTVGTCSISTP